MRFYFRRDDLPPTRAFRELELLYDGQFIIIGHVLSLGSYQQIQAGLFIYLFISITITIYVTVIAAQEATKGVGSNALANLFPDCKTSKSSISSSLISKTLVYIFTILSCLETSP